MALPKSGFGKDSAQAFVIDAGVVFKNVKYSKEGGITGDLLGATAGGVEVNIEKKYRKIEVDGTYVMDVKGLNVVESAQATFKTTLKEITADNLVLAMNGKQVETTEFGDDVMVIEDRYMVVDGDYIDNMAIVGTLSGTDKPIVFMLDHVLITSPLAIKMEDGSEVALEITGQANGDYEQLQQRRSPYRIIYPKTGEEEAAEPAETVAIEAKAAKSK